TINLDRSASQRCDGIDKEERVMISAEVGDRLKRLPGTGRGFGMHDRHGFYWAGSAQCLFHSLRLYDLPPWDFLLNRFPAATFDAGGPSCALPAGRSHDNRLARLNYVRDR